MNEIIRQGSEKFQNCSNWLKPNHRENFSAKIIICVNCNGRCHFAKYCKKATVNQINDSYGCNRNKRNPEVRKAKN